MLARKTLHLIMACTASVSVGLASLSIASAQATQYAEKPPLLLGAAWYPEQWPESRWEADLELMEAAHLHLVRVGEFAWSVMEPAEDKYDFAWLDRAIELAAKHHICVVLGTPTAAPPAWLTTKYPDTLRMDEKGVRDEHGNRQQFSFASERYRKFAHEITEKMAERYGHNPNVVGWQLDNEYAAPSFDPEAKAQFHAWLKAKYGTIDNLNNRWTTSYWSQTYDNFDEIPVREKGENPGLLLDWKHFVSDTWKSYSANQISAIRPHADKRQFITTNTMGWFDGFDEYVVHSNLDIAAWDDYIGDEHYDWLDNGARHDMTRGFKDKNFWVMETQPAFVNWHAVNSTLARGQVRDMAWQAIGHGADAVAYWQWRSALNGQEQYHGVLVGADGTPVPVYDEVKQVGEEFDKTGKALEGTTPQSSVALINDYDSRWAINFQRHNRNFDPVAEMVNFYGPLYKQAQSVDVISVHDSLDKYKLVVAAGLNVLSKETADHLLAYMKQGGNLVLGPRSGMKDEYDALNVERQPGPLVDALGGRVEQFYALEDKVPVSGDTGSGSASLWAEQLSAKAVDTQVLLRYGASNGWLDNQPAAITRKVGKGTITYVGAWIDDDLLAKLTSSLLQQHGVKPILPDAPDGVEVCQRKGNGHSVLILINHNTAKAHVKLPHEMRDLLGDGSRTSVDLPAYGVDVLSEK
ncbi:beta-galactosidase [Acidobacterium sp. S8]|uniref:beta-galactosidase n=1 Tax=Acidobacterium sp. S8 TaxID=1641854 RepID=UPI00131D2754|nr:beta-galactosidase [Acidobacterium sp. S8]